MCAAMDFLDGISSEKIVLAREALLQAKTIEESLHSECCILFAALDDGAFSPLRATRTHAGARGPFQKSTRARGGSVIDQTANGGKGSVSPRAGDSDRKAVQK